MTCSIPEIKKNDIEHATMLFVGKSTTWNVIRPGVIEMPTNMKFKTTNQLYNIALSNMKRVEKWAGAEEKYGPSFTQGWLDRIDQTSSRIVVYLTFPNRLEKALQVKDEVLSLEEANNELISFDAGVDFYMNDEALRRQDEREYEEFSRISDEEINEMINKKRDC
jgi:hypothetical protein